MVKTVIKGNSNDLLNYNFITEIYSLIPHALNYLGKLPYTQNKRFVTLEGNGVLTNGKEIKFIDNKSTGTLTINIS